MRLYVGNLNYKATEKDVRNFFSPRAVDEVTFVHDRETGRPRGFAFVELNDDDGRDAIAQLHGATLMDRKVVVNQAHEKPPKPGRGRDRRRDNDDRYSKE